MEVVIEYGDGKTVCRGMGCIPTDDFGAALRAAQKYVGKNPRVLVLPGAFLGVGVHLKR